MIAWKKCDDQEPVFTPLLEPQPRCEAGDRSPTSPEGLKKVVLFSFFSFPPCANGAALEEDMCTTACSKHM